MMTYLYMMIYLYIIQEENHHWHQTVWIHVKYLLVVMWSWSDVQRWPMGFAGSVRLGWKARCMDCGSVMTVEAFSSSLLRRHAAFGFRFLSVGFDKQQGSTLYFSLSISPFLFLSRCSSSSDALTSDLLFQTEDHCHSLVQHQQLGLRLLALQVQLTHVAQLLEGLVDVPHAQAFTRVVGHPPLTLTFGLLLRAQVLILMNTTTAEQGKRKKWAERSWTSVFKLMFKPKWIQKLQWAEEACVQLLCGFLCPLLVTKLKPCQFFLRSAALICSEESGLQRTLTTASCNQGHIYKSIINPWENFFSKHFSQKISSPLVRRCALCHIWTIIPLLYHLVWI